MLQTKYTHILLERLSLATQLSDKRDRIIAYYSCAFAGCNAVERVSTEINQTSSSTFICTDGTVVSLASVCDGVPHCPDSSDEVATLCRHVL